MLILGLPSFHNSGWGLVKDGKVVSAIQEERLNRVKSYPQHYRDDIEVYPMHLGIDYVFRETGLSLADCDAVTIPMIPTHDKLVNAAMVSVDSVDEVLKKDMMPPYNKLLNLLKSREFSGKVVFINHQLSHASYVYNYSGYNSCDILSYDGAGCGWPPEVVAGYHVDNHKYTKLLSHRVPHSLGHIYSNTTGRIFGESDCFYSKKLNRYMSDEANGKEGKVMGLASYGSPIDSYKMMVLDEDSDFYIATYQPTNKIGYEGVEPYSTNLGTKQENIPRREKNKVWDFNDKSDIFYADLAATAQKSIEDAAMHYVKKLKKITGSKNICLTGGVALNSCLNGLIKRSGIYESVFAGPATHDGGHGIGAPLYYYNHISEQKSEKISNDFLGYPYTIEDCKNAAKDLGVSFKEFKDNKSLTEDIADSLVNQKIIAVFSKGSEFGPRALGHRSIVVDPRTQGMKDTLNARVKFREAYRPFAPIVLKEHALDYFEFEESEYMLFVANATEKAIKEVPATIHVDGTARMQTVTDDNEPFYSMLNNFYRLTGVPVLLNTSFNIAGEPIVETPEDAIKCFLGTSIDILYLDFLKIEK